MNIKYVIMTKLTVKLMGGLGNQLFQIFTCMNHALKHGYEYTFTNELKLTSGTIRPTYWNSLLTELKDYTCSLSNNWSVFYEQNSCTLPEFKDNTMLFGYFQSDKYFFEYYNTILELTGLDTMIKSAPINVGTLSVHFRISGYREIQDVHPVMTKQWYQTAINLALSTNKFTQLLIFCQPEDYDEVTNLLKELELNIKYSFIDQQLTDWEQLLHMTRCEGHIVPNSTFSWWGAYLSGVSDVWICHPDNWFGHKYQGLKDHGKNLYPTLSHPEWNKVETDSKY